jgi:pyruvate carboxylase subunit B
LYDVRATVSGNIVSVVVDEGQLIAEDEPIALVDDGNQQSELVTKVPGVVRELYVEPGTAVSSGDVIARIDES